MVIEDLERSGVERCYATYICHSGVNRYCKVKEKFFC